MEGGNGGTYISPPFFTLALDGGEWSTSCPGYFTSRERCWVNPKTGLDIREKGKSLASTGCQTLAVTVPTELSHLIKVWMLLETLNKICYVLVTRCNVLTNSPILFLPIAPTPLPTMSSTYVLTCSTTVRTIISAPLLQNAVNRATLAIRERRAIPR
jgi:hypothetical protein